MKYKFEDLDVWKLSVQLNDKIYQIIDYLPDNEKFNLASQLRRAATSVSLNIAEGSTSTSNAEQSRFLTYSFRSLIEVIACLRLIELRNYVRSVDLIMSLESSIDSLFIKLQAFKRALN
jgi:four helix bundle protein